MRYGMLVCCIAVMLSISSYLLSGGTFGGLLDNLTPVVPLVACVGPADGAVSWFREGTPGMNRPRNPARLSDVIACSLAPPT